MECSQGSVAVSLGMRRGRTPCCLPWFLPLSLSDDRAQGRMGPPPHPTLPSWPGGSRSVQSLSRVRLFATPWTAACQASLSITNSRSLPKLMSVESVMASNHLTLCCPLLLLPSVFPSIRVFPSESVLRIRWPKYWGFMNTQD